MRPTRRELTRACRRLPAVLPVVRSLARLEAVGLVVRDRAAWLASRYVIAAEQLVERSAAWLRELAERGLARARAWVADNPFRQPEAAAQGAEAARRVRQAPELDDQALAALAPSPVLAQPTGKEDLEAWIAWALGQADELIRTRGIPRWAQSRSRRPADFARVTLAWGALRRPDAPTERVWGFAEGHARRILPHWRAVQEQDLDGLLWTLGLVWWAHERGVLRNWTADSRGRYVHRPIGLDEWLRCRPSRWETAVSQAETAWAERAAFWAERAAGDAAAPADLAEPAAEDLAGLHTFLLLQPGQTGPSVQLHPPIAAAAPGLVEAELAGGRRKDLGEPDGNR